MTRGRIGAGVAAALVVGLFLAGGVLQRERNASPASRQAVPDARAAAPRDAPAEAPRSATTGNAAGTPIAASPAEPASRLLVAFQLDRALTQGHYLGERWVSPPTFHFAQAGERYSVRARLRQVDARGERIEVSGDWATGDPDILAITRLGDGQVQLDILQPGTTELTVSAGGERKVLQVEARRTPDAMDVAFRQ